MPRKSVKNLIIFATAVSLLFVGCETQQESVVHEAPVVPVITAAPSLKDITVFLDSIGTLHPSVLMEVRPQIDGTIIDVLAREGQWVIRGMPLFTIDPKPYLIKIQEVEAQLAIDRANLQAAQKKLARFQPLVQKNLVAQTEWEDLEAEAEKFQAALALDEARMNSAKLDLEHCTLLAPISGRVGKLDAHPGHLIAKGQTTPLATISQMNPLIVEFTLTEKEFPKVSKDIRHIEIKSVCKEDSCVKGEMTFLDNHFDPKTGLMLVRGKVQNEDYSLRPGHTVQVRIPIGVTTNASLIPQKAIRYNQQGPYVYIVQPDMTVVIRQLILGEEQGTDQIVLEGLDQSDRLIIDGHLRLSPGLKVEVKS
jgi:membrane fusion protein, multidrug efflux system